MTLRDRLRRWWRPAQWEDDHPAERKQREQPKKNALRSWFAQAEKSLEDRDLANPGHINYERDFKVITGVDGEVEVMAR